MVVILGNGVAGNTAASTIRHLDSRIEITLISAETYPEYTACALPHYLAGEFERQRLFLKSEEDYPAEGIKTIFGRTVSGIDPEKKQVLLGDESLSYDKLIMATGSRPLVPPIPGVDLEGVFSLKSPGDADRILEGLGQTAVVVGSGPIGVETAISLKKQGDQVYLIELLERIMPKIFDEEAASLVAAILEEKGIRVLTAEKLLQINGQERVEGIVTDKQQIECDQVIMSVGVRPNVELARETGIEVGSLGGIVVSRRMETSLEGIYACGDCVQSRDMANGQEMLSPLWHNAKRQGIIAGYNCLGIDKIYPGSESITSLDVYGTQAVSFGSIAAGNEAEDVEVIEKYSGDNYYRLVISKGHLIGAQSIGNAQDMGALLYVLLKRENLDKIKSMIEQRITPLNLRHHRVGRYITPSAIEAAGER
jgi:NADH oxidase (H2O2-forming)